MERKCNMNAQHPGKGGEIEVKERRKKMYNKILSALN